jgi:hypothetical protein
MKTAYFSEESVSMRLKNYLVRKELKFDGDQLQSRWAEETFGLKGESIVAFVGPFDPRPEIVAFAPSCEIFRKRTMLHLVVEHSHADQEKLRLQQRLLVYVLKDKLNHRLKGDLIQRWGANLFHTSAQITVTFSSLTASSALIYVATNIQMGEPESKFWGLEDGYIDPMELAQAVMDQYIFEMEDMRRSSDRPEDLNRA